MRLPRSIELFLILIFICMTVALVVNAQTPPPSTGSSPAAPIDGLSGLLMAAGAGYAARHIYRNNRRNTP
jgi:hypothetical protein